MEGKYWCFTLNNYTEEDEANIIAWTATYLIYGRETGESGTKHLQGYCEWKNKKTLKTLKNLNNKCHWERRKGTGIQASEYCKKDKDFYECGELNVPVQGKRNDLAILKEKVKSGSKLRDIMTSTDANLPQIRYLEKYLTLLEEQRNWKPEVTWCWGPSGAGKTKYCFEQTKPEETYWKDGEKWWDGYDGQETVIIDDFRGCNMKFNYLLRVLDRYPLRVEVKGGYRQLLAKKIFITSIVHPEHIYTLEAEPIRQLIRRLDKIILFQIKVPFVLVTDKDDDVTMKNDDEIEKD
ncbi:MAG: replication-associated protein [Fish-associated circovirus]|nr:MAG: replication-associated protein [Fish-associated circovirus]